MAKTRSLTREEIEKVSREPKPVDVLRPEKEIPKPSNPFQVDFSQIGAPKIPEKEAKGGPGSDRPLTPEEQQSAGQQFISAREKALSQGAGRQEAVIMANQLTEGQTGRTRTVEEVQKRNAALQQAISNIPQLPTEKGLGINPGEVGAQVAEQALLGAAAGGVTGAAISAGALAVPGAIAGGVIGALRGLITGIKQEAAENIDLQDNDIANAKRSIRAITNAANKGIPVDIDIYLHQKAIIARAEAELKESSQGNVKNWLTDSRNKLIAIEQWRQSEELVWDQRFIAAISKPNAAIEYDLE